MAPSKSPPMDETYNIETATSDVAIEKRKHKRRLLEWLAISAVLRIFTITFYLGHRLRCMLLGNNGFNPADITAAWVFFAIEFFFAGKFITNPICTIQ